MSIKETLSESEQVPVWNPTGKRRRFGWLPDDIMARRDITASAKLVLLAMNMESFGLGGCTVSDQALCDRSGVGRTVVIESRRGLIKAGLIEPEGERVAQVQSYRFLHPDMQAQAGTRGKSGVITARTAVTCTKCSSVCRSVGKTGLCRTCAKQAETDRLVAEIVAGEPGLEDGAIFSQLGVKRSRTVRLAIAKARRKAAVA